MYVAFFTWPHYNSNFKTAGNWQSRCCIFILVSTALGFGAPVGQKAAG